WLLFQPLLSDNLLHSQFDIGHGALCDRARRHSRRAQVNEWTVKDAIDDVDPLTELERRERAFDRRKRRLADFIELVGLDRQHVQANAPSSAQITGDDGGVKDQSRRGVFADIPHAVGQTHQSLARSRESGMMITCHISMRRAIGWPSGQRPPPLPALDRRPPCPPPRRFGLLLQTNSTAARAFAVENRWPGLRRDDARRRIPYARPRVVRPTLRNQSITHHKKPQDISQNVHQLPPS